MKESKGGKITFNNNRKWIQKELKQSRTKRVIDLYSKMLLKGEPIDYTQLGKLYRIDQKEPAWSIKRLLKQKEVKEMIEQKLQDALLGEGVDYKFLISKRKQIIDLAESKDKLDIMLKGVEGFETMYSMTNPKREINTQTNVLDYKQMIEIDGKKQTNHLKASQTTETPDDQKDTISGDTNTSSE